MYTLTLREAAMAKYMGLVSMINEVLGKTTFQFLFKVCTDALAE